MPAVPVVTNKEWTGLTLLCDLVIYRGGGKSLIKERTAYEHIMQISNKV